MLEDIESLPRSKRHAARNHGNRQRRMRQRRADMRCHVIRPFQRVAEMFALLGYEAFEEIGEIERNIRIRIFLDDERAGCVLDENSQDSIERRLPAQPLLTCAGDRIQSFASCGNGDLSVGGGQTIRIRGGGAKPNRGRMERRDYATPICVDQNRLAGLRTPRTLSDRDSWDRTTHKSGMSCRLCRPSAQL